MSILLLAGATVLAIFLCGAVATAAGVTMKHRDSSATYKLDAVRDRLVRVCVFGGVPRNNPWLEILYSNLSSILLKDARALTPLPEGEKCPRQICALQTDLRDALEDLLRHRMRPFRGTAHERTQKCLQRELAKTLLEMIEEGALGHRTPGKSSLVSRLTSTGRRDQQPSITVAPRERV
jgi:hypothetical protein